MVRSCIWYKMLPLVFHKSYRRSRYPQRGSSRRRKVDKSLQLARCLRSKHILWITLNFFELVTAGVSLRSGHRSLDSHLTVQFVGTNRCGVCLLGLEKEAADRKFHKHKKLAAWCLNMLNLKWIAEFVKLDSTTGTFSRSGIVAEVVGFVHEAVTIWSWSRCPDICEK